MTPERFYARLQDTESGCVEWQGPVDRDGYGRIRFGGCSTHAHRVAWELANGPVPDGLQIDHLCRNKVCCNPEHLDTVTMQENVRRGRLARGAAQYATHCKHGHAFTPENTYRRAGRRSCRACNAAAVRRYQLRKRVTS